ncbi:NADPH oxidase 5 [Chiroxiphia lanceolata]|uniref:NADPH oxidase 5 n=1 Tax=Chiroxiphia lanceolata TaxID=296741 RepID=UPI0013CE7267|nr:NADPH oxidase 5 [Chiroxiphia lanceolata]
MGTAGDAEWLHWVTKQFGNIAGKDKEISLEEFKSALQVKESFFAERFFALFDADGSGTISLEELLRALRLLVHGDQRDKLSFLFQVYDVDGSGSIEAEELQLVLRWCLRESSVSLPEERLGDLTRALLEAADRDHSGSITFPELQEQLEAFPELMENLTISAASWLKPPEPPERPRPRCLSRGYWYNHRGQLGCLGGFAALNLLLFTLAALRHRGLGPAIMVARGCGQGLNLDCALLAVPMLRRCLTWLRSTAAAEALPLDQPVQCHQLVGYVVLALGAAHSGAHIAHLARLAQRDGGPALLESLLWARPGGGGVGGTAPQTGLALLALLLAMGTFSSPCVRRRGHFEVFYWTHLSYISVWTLLILHGPHFWKWFVVPGSLFVLEKVLGWAWRRAGGLHIVEVNLLPSKVTHLVIQRPPSFHFRPGDYVYLNVPAIASYEWHPFSISSAPEQPETLWLHIRSLGQWTNRLYEYFQQLESPSPEPNPPGRSRSWAQEGSVASGRDGSVQLTAFRATAPGQDPERGGSTGLGETRRLCSVKCFLDGPYGTPTRRIFLSEHAVLIGAGIGITPFASILQSIMYRYRRRRQSCPSCHHSWCEELRDQDMTLRKVDFIWINRDQKHFEWFLSLLSKLEREQAELEPGGRFLELHLYMTSALARSDVKALGLQVALDLLAAKEKRDSITGLRTRTQPGRPDWGKVFGKVAQEQVGKVQVFFCGSPALAKVIRGHCERFGFRFSRENF